MGQLEPDKTTILKEVGICVQVRATTQAQANEVVNIAEIHFVHAPYQHQLATAGNFAWLFTPCGNPMGPLSECCIYHIMRVQDLFGTFPQSRHRHSWETCRTSRQMVGSIPSSPSLETDNFSSFA
jgi:hypothetical protein